MTRIPLIATLALAMSFPAVSKADNLRFHVNQNTVLGAVIGGVIGYQYNKDKGAVVGSLLGALAGSSVADYQRKRWHEFEYALQSAQAAERRLMQERLRELELQNALVISLAGSDLFEGDSLALNQAMHPALGQIAQSMKDYPDAVLTITGHTDSDGKEYFNRILGLQRAEAVANYLILQGIARSRLKTEGVGEAQPIMPNDTDENKLLNNRVEIKPL